jgi:aryl-alcohol dehydrogenase-like predicted oxidoreductase
MPLCPLGKEGPRISRLGLGTWSLGGSWRYGWGPADDREAIRTIQTAIDELGINWIDTAPVYGLGHAEELVGRAIKERRNRVILATKCGLSWSKKGKLRHDLSPVRIRQEVEESLARLDVETIDLYQIHWPDPNVPLIKTCRALRKLKREGLVRHLGVSNVSVEQLSQCRDIFPVTSVQPPYNLFRREIETDLLPYCRQHHIGVIPYSPLASGLLSGSFNPRDLDAHDWRRRDVDFQPPRLECYLNAVDRLRPIARHHQVDVGQIAIAWLMHQPGISGIIVGSRTVDQIQASVRALQVNLDPDQLHTIDKLSQGAIKSVGPKPNAHR